MGCKGKIIAIAKCPPGRAATRLHTFLGKSPTLGADTRVQLTAAAFTLDGWVEGASEANPTDSLKKKRSKPSEIEDCGEEPKTPEQHKSKKKKNNKEKTKKNT